MKRQLIKTVAQWFANGIITSLQTTKDESMQRILIEQGAALNAYCIVFHDIYLN